MKPFSIINFVGPAAGVASAFMLLWGARTLLGVLLGTILFNIFLYVYFDYYVEPAINVISFMAIVLQAFWTKQLSYKYIYNQRWLNSRALLFAFLTKIGPLAGIVAASATVLVAVLDAKIMAGSLFYAFFGSWAGSMLVAVFLTPSLLFTQGQQKLTLLKRFFVIFASILGSLAIVLLFVFSQKSHQHYRLDHFEAAKNDITHAIEGELEQVTFQVDALSALMMASDKVTATEFQKFVTNIFAANSTVRALEWVPAVTNDNKSAFEQFASEQLKQSYSITEQSVMGELIQATTRPLYFPVLYAYPAPSNIADLGLDLFSHPDKFTAMNAARRSGKIVASAPVTLVQDDFSSPGSLMFFPVFNSAMSNHYGEQLDSNFVISGYILAVVQFERFFQDIKNIVDPQQIEFSILDNSNKSPYVLFGQEREYKNRLVEHFPVNVFSRQWQVTVYESQPWDVQAKTWQTWGLLIGGTLGGIFFQILILMMAAYSTELSNQVTLKTRELILAKEQSDHANFAKTKFLATLAVEFQSPLYALRAFLDNYKDKKLADITADSVGGLANATQSIGHLVEHLNDLNSIESGKVTLNNQKLDLHDLMHRSELSLKATARLRGQAVKVLLGKNVPQFIEVDEYRLQQLLTIMTDNAFSLLQTDVLRLSVKAHLHKLASTSIFFVFTADETLISEQNSLFIFDDNNHELEGHSTAMAMVKELSQLLGGNAKIVNLPSGSSVISVSIMVDLPSVNKLTERIIEQDFTRHDEMIASKDVLLASYDENLVVELTPLFAKLDRKVDVISSQQEIFKALHQYNYKLIIIDGDDERINAVRVAEQIRRNSNKDSLAIIGVFSGTLSNEQLLDVKATMNGYLKKPVNINKLKYYFTQGL